jgi:Rieske Fe-S protein
MGTPQTDASINETAPPPSGAPMLQRRHVLLAGAGGLLVLAGCSGRSGGPTARGETTNPELAAGKMLAKVSDVPVGGSISAKLSGEDVLIARPAADHVVAFSAVCTHMGCIVKPAGAEFHCPCHGSRYDAATGAVKAGPAPAALPAIAVHVVDGEIVSGS